MPNQSEVRIQITNKVTKLIIAVAGLIVVRLIVAALPMLKDAPSIGGTGVYPLTAVKVVIDTLIFIVLLRYSTQISSTLRAAFTNFTDCGSMLNLAVVTVVVILAYNSYGDLIHNILGSDSDIYGWLALIFALAPIAGIIVLAARNLDTVTHLMSGRAKPSAITAKCPKCGSDVHEGAKFCSECGSGPAPSGTTPVQAKPCPSCGASTPDSAKFCEKCGNSLQIVSVS